jgi:hypothetical protein
MELTGNTLKDFWVWYLLPKQRKTYKTNSLRGGDNVAKIRFLAMSFAERYGVLEDYFDSVDIRITINTGSSQFWADIYIDLSKDLSWDSEMIDTRKETRGLAVGKANELRNKQLNDTIWN